MEGGTRRANLDLKPFTIRKVQLQSRHRQEAGWKYARAWMEARFALCRSPETHGSLVQSSTRSSHHHPPPTRQKLVPLVWSLENVATRATRALFSELEAVGLRTRCELANTLQSALPPGANLTCCGWGWACRRNPSTHGLGGGKGGVQSRLSPARNHRRGPTCLPSGEAPSRGVLVYRGVNNGTRFRVLKKPRIVHEARAGLLRAVPCDSGKAPCRRGSHKDAALAG